MKRPTILLLFFFSLLAFSQEKKSYEIGILIDEQTEELSPLLNKLKEEIKAVVGEDANVSFPDEHILINGYDLETARNNYLTLEQNSSDIILALGPINNEVVGNIEVFKKPTILFGAVNSDLIDFDFERKVSGIENFTY
ncbi:MAG: hypothetical protein AAFO99_11880, partial [Bacteroidota bacterium]